MARFKVSGPDGKSYAIEAPDSDTAAKEADAFFATKVATSQSEAPKAPDISAVADSAIGAGAGVTKGTLDLGTGPADIATMGADLARKLGVSEDTINKIKAVSPYVPIGGQALAASQALRKFRGSDNSVAKGLKDYEDYKPQTTAGKYAKSIGEFVPGALGGEEGLGLRALKYAVAPGVASEALGQAAEGTKEEPYARAAGGLLGLGAGGLLNPLAEARAVSKLPSEADFAAKASAAYDDVAKSGVYIPRQTMNDILLNVRNHIDSIGFVPGKHRDAAADLDQLNKDINGGKFGNRPLTFKEATDISERMGQGIRDLDATNKGDRRILWAAKHEYDAQIQGLNDSQVFLTKTGTPEDLANAKAALTTAKAFYTKKSKSELLDQLVQAGEDTGKSIYTRGGVEHGTRREFLKFLRKNPNRRQSLTNDELAQFRKVSHGTLGGNAARGLSKLSNSVPGALTYGGIAGGAAGALLGGPAGAIVGVGVPALGYAAKAISKASTRKAIADAQSLIRTGSKLRRGYKSKAGALITLNELRQQ